MILNKDIDEIKTKIRTMLYTVNISADSYLSRMIYFLRSVF